MLQATTIDLPIKVSDRTFVILKHLPVAQRDGCGEYLMADAVFAKVEKLVLRPTGRAVELEIISTTACRGLPEA
jgi:hypothetical protein